MWRNDAQACREIRKKLQVHEHCFVSGPLSSCPYYKFSHSHEGGDVPHEHPATGPAAYTIDKDEWFRQTGLRGGGRKKFTAMPTGDQLPLVVLTEEENSFDVIICGPPAPPDGPQGPGIALPMRMILGCGMRVGKVVRDAFPQGVQHVAE